MLRRLIRMLQNAVPGSVWNGTSRRCQPGISEPTPYLGALLLDGEPVLSCLQLAVDVLGKRIETIEGLQNGNELHPLQNAFADLGAAQCGYCTPGILMVARALIDREPNPTEEQITEALAGNICRCTGYKRIIEGVKWGAAMLRGDDWRPAEEYFSGSEIPAMQEKA